MAVWSSVRTSGMSSDLRWDSEFYRPEYLRLDRAIARLSHQPLAEVADVSDGNHLTIAEQFTDEGVRYLRGQDLDDFFISDSDPIYIPREAYELLGRSHMFSGDVLVSVVGTIGNVGFVTDHHGLLTGSCKLAIVRPKTLPGEYLAAYLASAFGQQEIKRRVRGAVQMGLILPDLKQLPVAIPSDSQRRAIVKAVREAEARRRQSRAMLQQAEDDLVAALGMDRSHLEPTLTYSRRISEMLECGRFGSEYYMPAKSRVIRHLTDGKHRLLSDHFTHVKTLLHPAKADANGLTVRNYNLGDAFNPFLDDTKQPVPAGELGSAKKRFQAGDVVVSRLRSYLKQIAIVRASGSVPCVGSSEFIVLRPTPGGLSAEALLVYLRSEPVQTVLKWSQDGSNHPRFNENELLSLPIPDAVAGRAPKIDALVDQSIRTWQETYHLIDKAKSIVDGMILGNTNEG